MADKKISQLTSLAQGDIATTTDVLAIVDTSATETKKATAAAIVGAAASAGLTNVDINSGAIDGTAIGASSASTGAFTTLSSTGNSNLATSSGNVGVGTTSPVAKLAVQDSTAPKIALQVGAAEKAFLDYTQSTGVTRLDSDGPLSLASYNTEAVYLASSQYVGIGTQTPDDKLSVAGNIGAAQTGNAGFKFYSAAPGAYALEWFLYNSTSLSNALQLSYYNSGTFGGTVLTVNKSGNIGINTSSPTNKLTVDGNANVTGNLDVGTLSVASNLTLSGGTANGVLYLNGSKVATSGSALTFDGTQMDIGVGAYYGRLNLARSSGSPYATLTLTDPSNAANEVGIYLRGTGTNPVGISSAGAPIAFYLGGPGTTEAMRLTSTGLGIGTTSPAYKLDVQTSAGRFQVQNYGAGSVLLYSNGALAYNAATTRHEWQVAGSSLMQLEASGNLGLGVTPSAWRSNTPAFQVGVSGGASLFSDSGVAAAIGNNMFLNASSQYIYQRNDASSYYQQYQGAHKWYTAPSGTAGNAITFTQAMTLDASGNLGLGVTPSAWLTLTAFQMPVGGLAGFSGTTTNKQFHFLNNTYYGSGGWLYRESDYAQRLTTVNGQYQFHIAPQGTAGNVISFTQAMTLDASGNLGVGTTSPGAKLEVYGGASGTVTNVQIGNASTAFQVGVDSSNNIQLRTAQNVSMLFYTNNSERARIDSSGNLLVGATANPGILNKSVLVDSGASSLAGFIMQSDTTGRTSTDGGAMLMAGTDMKLVNFENSFMSFATNNTERARIDSSGNLLVGTTSSSARVFSKVTDGTVSFAAAGTTKGVRITHSSTSSLIEGVDQTLSASYQPLGLNASDIRFSYSGTEAARITSAGDFVVGKTALDLTVAGCELRAAGLGAFTRSGNPPLWVNRLFDDGTLVEFQQASVTEGTISVSGNTVSYNAFAGSHWSQLQDGSKPDILRGTVMESINELCVWPGEANERLPKAKISDTAGSKKVYGVFMAWDNDWTETNDMYVTAVGAFICRVNGSVTVEEGDLLESNGDGTARVQADDIIRGSTIGKVTSTVKTHEYDDGSYCVPTVLYCG